MKLRRRSSNNSPGCERDSEDQQQPKGVRYSASPIDDITDPAERYIRNCARFELRVDSNVVIALRTKWKVLKPTQHFTEGALLPLMGILDNDTNIKKLNLAYVSMQDSR